MKRSSNRLVLLVGIFLAVVAFVLIAVMMSGGGGAGGPSAPPTTAKVVVAATDIPLGSRITSSMLSTKDIPIGEKPVDSYSDVSLVIGQTARQPVASGQLISSVILNASGSIQNIDVPAGYVGIAVQVDQITGVGTLIKPGDRVDVVTGFSAFPVISYTRPNAVPTPRPTGSPNASTEAVLENVGAPYDQNSVKTVVEGLQVLGTLLPPATDQGQAQGPAASGQPGTTLTGQQQIVILAATSQQAEAIRFAQVSGTIALVLRSSSDCQASDGTPSACPIIPTTGVTLRKMVDDFGVLPPQVVEVLMPTPYPSPMPSMLFPSPSPSPSGLASPSANP